MRFEGKKALITGGCSGMGRITALKLASEGADVAIFDLVLNEEVAEEIRAMGREAYLYQVNVVDFEDVKEKCQEAQKAMGRIDILVNIAGIAKDGIIAMMKEEAFDSVVDIKLKGTFNTIRHCMPFFIKQRSGRIINISSVSALMGNAGQANYDAANAGVIGLSKATAKELASRGVTCNVIAPGFIETRMTENLKDSPLVKAIPMKRMGKPEEIADVILFLASDSAAYITGEVIRVDGGIAM